ncbi:MAG: methyltransferase domain-containing protein [Promethearchaeota archaeon]
MDVDSFGPLEEVNCAICGCDRSKLVTVQNWFGERFHIVRCIRCKLMFTNPRPTPEWRERYYDPRYNPVMKMLNRDFIHLETPGRLSAYKRLLKFLKDEHHTGTKLLDGGCAAGQFVKMAMAEGFDATGVECSPGAIAHAYEHFGLELIQAKIENIPVADNTYDIVTLLEVFEHFADPMIALQEVKRVLKPGGILFIETPNYLRFYLMEKYFVFLKQIYLKIKRKHTDSWARDLPWFPFDHLYHWTPKTLLSMLNKAGFKHNKIHFIPNYNYEMLTNGSLTFPQRLEASFFGSLFKLMKGRLNLWGMLVTTAVKP